MEKEEKRTKAYVDEIFRQIQQKPDIVDILIVNQKGNPVKTTMQEKDAIQFAGSYGMLVEKTQIGIQKMDDEDELLMLRVRTKNHEIFITPDAKITAMVVQNPKDRMQT